MHVVLFHSRRDANNGSPTDGHGVGGMLPGRQWLHNAYSTVLFLMKQIDVYGDAMVGYPILSVVVFIKSYFLYIYMHIYTVCTGVFVVLWFALIIIIDINAENM